ncbi:molybdate ABC transporter permease subunit [Schlesneria paludicola]|uniref:molybdate ABC transporter permease subunit n=1 Tax=Schlesneria paludicola TaxID=360056 RepID=UPI00029A784A|nr:molybdate ABC transporter permease subunit [Schlesneria paludicola]
MDWNAIGLTIKLAGATTLTLFLIGLPLAYWLAMSHWRGKFLIEAVVALPLILPPTVLGFYLLTAMGPHSLLGATLERWGCGRLVFSFSGILIGSILFNLPFAVRPFTAAFMSMDRRLIEAGWCLGVSRFETFRRVTLPLCWPGILAGLILTFAHTVGEFGVVLMIGGNIPNATRTLSITIYDDVQALNYGSAGRTALFLLLLSFAVLCATQWLVSRRGAPR